MWVSRGVAWRGRAGRGGAEGCEQMRRGGSRWGPRARTLAVSLGELCKCCSINVPTLRWPRLARPGGEKWGGAGRGVPGHAAIRSHSCPAAEEVLFRPVVCG